MRLLNATYCVMANPFMPCLVVDEQNAHTEDTELPSPLEKDSEDENRDSEKDEDTKELEAVSCKCFCCFLACSPSYICEVLPNIHLLGPLHFIKG